MIRRFLILFAFLSANLIMGEAVAQSLSSATDICSYLRQTGRVKLIQPDQLTLLITDPAAAAQMNQSNGKIMTQGYRIRVFSGNQQAVSKNKAYSIKSDLLEFMPELDTYIIFKSPNWRLTAGNFRTSEEAHATLRILKSRFPAYGREMFVVKEDIEL